MNETNTQSATNPIDSGIEIILKDNYIRKVRDSAPRRIDRRNRTRLLEMLDHYDVNGLRDLTFEQVKSYYENYCSK